MKKILTAMKFTSVLLVVFYFNAFSQWTQLTSGVVSELNAVYFVNENTGYVVGASGKILKTTNGGADWTSQTSGTSSTLKAISFLDENRGFIVGYSGTILYTTNGGSNWTIQSTIYSSFSFSGVQMLNDSVAFVTGGDIYGDGNILRTTNRGENWSNRHSTVYMRGLYAHSPSQVFAVGGGTASSKIGVYRKTINGGLDWTGPATSGIDRPTCVFFVGDNIGYIAGFSGTMNKTTDGGNTWTSLTTGTTIAPFSSIWFSSTSNGYATCGNILYTEKGLYKTTNGGDNWVKETLPVDKKLFGVFGINDNAIYLVGEGGTILKKGTGTTPSVPVAAFTANVTSGVAPLTVQFTDQSTGVPSSWYWTFGDGGNSTEQNPSHQYTSAGIYTVVLTVNNGLGSDALTKTDYITVTSGGGTSASIPYSENFESIWIDKDGGVNSAPSAYWTNTPAMSDSSWRRNDYSPWTSGTYSPGGANGTTKSARFHSFLALAGRSGKLDLAIDFSTAIGSKELKFYYTNATGTDKLEVYVSTDGGSDFGTLLGSYTTTSGWEEKTIQLGAINTSNGVIRFKAISDWGNDDIGLDEVRVTAGSTDVIELWTPQASGVTQNLIWVHFINASTGWVVGIAGTILKTTNGGAVWSKMICPITDDLYTVFFTDALYGWAAGGYTKILNTTDGGTNWTEQTSGTTNRPIGMYFTDRNNGWICGDGGMVLHTTNGGANWVPQTTNTSQHLADIHFVNETTGWAGGQHGTVIATTDGGVNWTSQNPGVSSSVYHFGNMDFVDTEHGWVVGGQGTVIRTTDGGETWNSSITSISDTLWFVDFVDQQEGWIISVGGVLYHSLDGGVTWDTVQTGITNPQFSALCFSDKNNGWIVGGFGSIYRFGTSATDIQVEQANAPHDFALLQNYPNPFNPSTVITYSIPKSSEVVVRIYNLLGQQVATLVKGYQEAGRHSIVFDAGRLSSGIYIYHISAGDYSAVKKMTLIK